ncbi:MAG: site-2 protease family protein [Anaerolineaceae bacterium]|nr:site-2 protease family protein [Anaerolineaceae bacterium]
MISNIFGTPAYIISLIVTLLIAFTFHELSHALVATAYGDDTPRLAGRLTLNPLAHLDPIGTILLLVAHFGWAKPVPIDPYTLRRRSSLALLWVSLAGPASNLIMAGLAAIPLRLGILPLDTTTNGILPTPSYFLLAVFIPINLTLFLFNLIPVAPLDGEKILDAILPPGAAQVYDRIRPYGPLILLAIVFVLPALGFDVLGFLIGPALNAIFRLLLGVPG